MVVWKKLALNLLFLYFLLDERRFVTRIGGVLHDVTCSAQTSTVVKKRKHYFVTLTCCHDLLTWVIKHVNKNVTWLKCYVDLTSKSKSLWQLTPVETICLNFDVGSYHRSKMADLRYYPPKKSVTCSYAYFMIKLYF